MGICTVGVASDEFVVRSPAFINVCRGKPKSKKDEKLVMIPVVEIEGSGSAEIRKKAHEMVDKALDEYEETMALLGLKAPEGTIRVWSDECACSSTGQST